MVRPGSCRRCGGWFCSTPPSSPPPTRTHCCSRGCSPTTRWRVGPLFSTTSLGPSDVNRFVDLARPASGRHARSAPRGERSASARRRETMGPRHGGRGAGGTAGRWIDVGIPASPPLWRDGFHRYARWPRSARSRPYAAESIRRVAAATEARSGSKETSEAVILVADHVVLAFGGVVGRDRGGPGHRRWATAHGAVRRLEAIEIGDAGGDANRLHPDDDTARCARHRARGALGRRIAVVPSC